jgi:hypothetical protein
MSDLAPGYKEYMIGNLKVVAKKSEGGGFYEVNLPGDDTSYRYLADVFESVAKPVQHCGFPKGD